MKIDPKINGNKKAKSKLIQVVQKISLLIKTSIKSENTSLKVSKLMK